MKKLFYETEEFLKEKVEKIESEILALTDDGAACCVSDDKGAYLAKLIEERKDTLDALFQATPNEVMRMDKLNDQLKAITRQMHEYHHPGWLLCRCFPDVHGGQGFPGGRAAGAGGEGVHAHRH